jgi:membrane protein YdbS with pleckstrin-like domain
MSERHPSADGASSRPLSPSPPPDFLPLDPRVIQLWRIVGVIGVGIILLLPLGTLLRLGAARLGGSTKGFLLWLPLAAASGVWAWWFPKRRYQAWGYRINTCVLETRSGVWFRVLKLLPLSRLQHVDLHRGPLERAQGLASLVLHTAGTHEATHVIPGLDADEAVRLRDRLVAAGGDDAV